MPASPAEQPRDRPWRAFAILAVACAGCLLPFIDKAYHIDDPCYLWAGRQIQKKPLDFYGFSVNWYGVRSSMADVNKNPPLVSYYIAVAAAIVGWSEPALHLAFLPLAIAVVWGTYRLAESLCGRPMLAALATLFTPLFLISATNVMCEVLTLAFWVWSIVYWDRGLKRGSFIHLIIAALLISLCTFSKYLGASLLPLLLAYTLVHKETVTRPWRLARAIVALLLPIAAMCAYEKGTEAFYGRGLLISARDYANDFPSLSGHNSSDFIVGLAFIGGGAGVCLSFLPLLWRRWQLAAVIGISLLPVIDGALTAGVISNYSIASALQFVVFSLAGAGVVILALLDVARRRDSASVLLLLWVLGIWTFGSYMNWTITGRALLPLVPAVGTLIARRLDDRFGPAEKALDWRTAWPLVPAAALALLTAWADCRLADSAREAAANLCRRYEGRTIYFQGHWGFQYYMEQHGGKAVDRNEREQIRSGDVVILPTNNTNVNGLDLSTYRFPADQQPAPVTPCCFLGTMNRGVGAGFYASSRGPLPFAFGKQTPEGYRVAVKNSPALRAPADP